MTPDELKQERLRRGMTYAEFGEWIAQKLTATDPDGKEVKAYSRQRVYDWEHKVVPVPARVEAMLLREEIDRLKTLWEHELAPGGKIDHDEHYTRKELNDRRKQLEAGNKAKAKKRGRDAERDDW